jgi:hypothetical protein
MVVVRQVRGSMVAVALAASGCSSLLGLDEPIAATVVDGAPVDAVADAENDAAAVDAEPDAALPIDIVHVPAEAEIVGTADLVWRGVVHVDTTNLQAGDRPLPPDIDFDVSPQEHGDGPELAILHVGTLTIEADAWVRVIGSRPLVVLARSRIDVAGQLDVSARLVVPGPGAATTNGGGVGPAGKGPPGSGGGGHASAGGRGGGTNCMPGCIYPGGDGGEEMAEPLVVLVGGGSGGHSPHPTCDFARRGGGGGAVQLYAGESISVAGSIRAGGAGGGGGPQCGTAPRAAAGGGAGGTIVLQAPVVTVSGMLAVNGGGGGVGGSSVGPGGDGADGRLDAESASGGPAAPGGAGGGSGGSRAARAASGGSVFSNGGGGGGGGGGAEGRIEILVRREPPLATVASPLARIRSY